VFLFADTGGKDLQAALQFIEHEFLARLPPGKAVSIQVFTARWKRDIKSAFEDVKQSEFCFKMFLSFVFRSHAHVDLFLQCCTMLTRKNCWRLHHVYATASSNW